MHNAGLAGMARRVPEYADVLLPFTTVGFHGTLLLIYSTLIFMKSIHIYLSNTTHANYS